jgi:hypothetical protein
VFEADLEFGGDSVPVVAKFFDPHRSMFENGLSWEKAPSSFMFKKELRTYRRLSGAPFCLRFYGAFLGLGFTRRETGLVILERLSDTFKDFSDMSPGLRETAYNLVLELHKRGIHHGDVAARNFGLRFPSESEDVATGNAADGEDEGCRRLVIYDFSHSSFFQECDPIECELERARDEIINLVPP